MEKDFEMRFLQAMAKTSKNTTIIMVNGFQMKNAIILDVGEKALLISEGGTTKIIYKHAISTISVWDNV